MMHAPPESTPAQFTFWLEIVGPLALNALTRALTSEPIATLGDLAQGAVNLLDGWLNQGFLPRRTLLAHRQEYDAALEPAFRIVERRLDESPDDLALLAAYWRLAYRVNTASQLDEPTRLKAAERAQAALGRLRARLRSTALDDNAAKDGLGRDFLHYGRGVDALGSFRGLWPALRVMLLALRALPAEGVTPDLRYWNEHHERDEDQPRWPWRWVPETLSRVVHGFARLEQERQPDLRDVREEFADWCLERIETSDRRSAETRKARTPRQGKLTDEDFVEPSPVWRACFVRAVGELRVNPRGKGHRRLEWLAKNDPDETVRREAAATAETLRHGPTLPEGSSPRRPIFGALWQLRQAQFLAPGGEQRTDGQRIHPDGAKRTRQKEVQRTKEVEAAELTD